MNFTLWNNQDLQGTWEFSRKIDGVRVHHFDGESVSRSNKPLYNIPPLPNGIYEAFDKNWETIVGAVRRHTGPLLDKSLFYSLNPIDPRLFVGNFVDPLASTIKAQFELAHADGHEGLVLKQGDKLYKVKNKETYDVKVTGIQPGTGRNLGRMGALLTEKGKVGTGFTDTMRVSLNTIELGTVIEVECMGLTPSGKFRHPRFIRVRYDKS
jgi:hypothetical protein